MKLTSYSLRTLLIGVTVVCATTWASYQIRWIHQRHAFLEAHRGHSGFLCTSTNYAPWPLRMFGEQAWEHSTMYVHQSDVPTAKELFPEVKTIMAVEGTDYVNIHMF